MTSEAHILIVDDQPYQLLVLEEMLKTEGVLHRASNGLEAMASLDVGVPIDLIVSDIVMPELDGIEFCRRLKKDPATQDIPLLLVTSLEEEVYEETALALGADDFIRKPFSPQVVLARVRNHLRLARAKQSLQERNRQLEAVTGECSAAAALADHIAQYTNDGVLITDSLGTILSVNPAFTRITGYSADEVIGQTPKLLRSDRHGPEFYQEMWRSISEQGHWSGEVWNRRRNGEAYLERLNIYSVGRDDGRPHRYISIFCDITEVRQQDERIREIVSQDPLTGLPNRSVFDDRLRHGISLAQRSGDRLGLLIIDLDRFKAINDSLGHPLGDALLEKIAGRMKAVVRRSDTLARLGGDEFGMIVEGVEKPEDCASLAQTLLATIADELQIGVQALQITASIGITLYPDDGNDPVVLIRNADAAMYAAKAAGRGTYRFFQATMTDRALQRLTLEMELRHAIKLGQLRLHYQPKVRSQGGRLCGLEALLRWQHPRLGAVPPAEFIPVAEEAGLIGELGEWVLHEACRQAAGWRDKGLEVPRIAINLSARQLKAGGLPAHIRAVAESYGLSCELLELELTESQVMEDPEEAIATFRDLKSIGVRIAIDDFGTGYSSLAYLRRLPIDVLKIDRSFVMEADRDPEARQLVTMIVALGRSLNLELVAEGVENGAQAALLGDSGCDVFQGYFFSRPLSALEAERHWLQAGAHCADRGSIGLLDAGTAAHLE